MIKIILRLYSSTKIDYSPHVRLLAANTDILRLHKENDPAISSYKFRHHLDSTGQYQ